MQARPHIKEVFPYLRVKDANAAIAFYTKIFGAKELYRLTEPSGRVGHVELELGPITLMLCEEFPEYEIYAPPSTGAQGFSLHLHVDDCDTLGRRAVAAGAVMVREPSDAFYGERSCTIRDPFGHTWLLGHEIEAGLTPEEMQRRYTALFE